MKLDFHHPITLTLGKKHTKQSTSFIVIHTFHSFNIIFTIQDSNRNIMNLNTKQHTMQYTTIPDGDGGGDDIGVGCPTPWWTRGWSYSVLGGLVLLLMAAAVVLQGGGGHPYDPAGSSLDGVYSTPPTSAAKGMVLASTTTLRNDAGFVMLDAVGLIVAK